MVTHEFMFRLRKNGKRIHLARGWGGHVESSRFDSQLGMEKNISYPEKNDLEWPIPQYNAFIRIEM